LAIPSLINRAYVLDLAPKTSLLGFLSENGIRPFLLDWGVGVAPEELRSLEGAIVERMEPALSFVQRMTRVKPFVMGYCMGGTLATALACLAPKQVAGLALLATPWDFHQANGVMKTAADHIGVIASVSGVIGDTPIDALQTFFAQIDPLAVPKKFSEFAGYPQQSAAATRFVAIEDWLNDGVCLDAEMMKECLHSWYVQNEPARGVWKIDQTPIRPEKLDLPVWMAIPERDRLVPPESSLALAHSLRRTEVLSAAGGHIGVVAGPHARTILWPHFLRWIRRIAALQKKSW
jgi:polyhydroxyalkanoate synthase